MKQTVAVVCIAGLSAGMLAACTPKPVSAEPVVEDFFAALEQRDSEAAQELVDSPTVVADMFNSTFDGLQAEAVDFQLKSVEQQDNSAVAHYSVAWTLPRERHLTYDTSLNLSKAGDEWTVRWQPSLIHPDLGARQRLELRPVVAERASVVSSDGVALMTPGLQYRLLVDTGTASDLRGLAGRIASAVNEVRGDDATVPAIDALDLANSLEESRGTYSVGVYDDRMGPAIGDILADAPGVRLNEEPALVTRDKGFATDIMSRVRTMVNDELEGSNGWRVAVVNENGAALRDVEFHDASPAPAIKVSIDYDVQRAAEEAVNLRADSKAMLVAIRPSTGEILAVAQTGEADKDGDVALNGQYPPGSTFKIITAAAGVQDQGLTSGSIVPCPGTMDIYGRVVTNYNGFSLGSVPLAQAFASSCNTTFADISTKLEQGQLKDIAKSFGLGIDYEIPGLTTVTGSVPEGESALDRTEAGYGQGYDLASPFGMALVSATVAAGRTPTPTLVDSHETKASEEAAPLERATLDNVRSMMRQVVTSGTAAGMQANGEIYAKTGEAEINEGSHAWFTGYRDDDIAFATLVVLGGGSETSVSITDAFFQNLDRFRSEGSEAPSPPPEG